MSPFEFQSVLFNSHDVILIMTAMQCLFFGSMLFITNNQRVKYILFLTGFLFAHALIPINELIMWADTFKFQVRQYWMFLYFWPYLAYFVDAVLLLFCIEALVFKNFHLKKRDLLHLLPLAMFMVFLALTFFGHTQQQRIDLIYSESFVYSASFVSLELFSKILRVCYVIACLVLISRYQKRLQDTESNFEQSHVNWLKFLVVGFLIVMTSEVILVGSKVLNYYITVSPETFSIIGLTGNYITFFLVNFLVFTAVRNFTIIKKVEDKAPAKNSAEDQFVNPEMANDIKLAMHNSKFYMDPDITLEKLADSLSILPRDLSMLINRHFGINFYEFINQYRIEEAKRMLADSHHKQTTITDIYLAVGFNSKSVFYTFFKKSEGMTPSQYRKAQQSAI